MTASSNLTHKSPSWIPTAVIASGKSALYMTLLTTSASQQVRLKHQHLSTAHALWRRARNRAEGARIKAEAQQQAAEDAARDEARRQSARRSNAETAAANAVLQVRYIVSQTERMHLGWPRSCDVHA